MTAYEQLTLFLSMIAILTSVTAIIRQGRVSKRQLELEEEQARFATFQRELMEQHAAALEVPLVEVGLHTISHDGELTVSNVGGGTALNVRLEWQDGEPPFLGNQEQRKLPIPSLRSGKSVTLRLAFSMGCQTDFTVVARWAQEDGSEHEEEFRLHAY